MQVEINFWWWRERNPRDYEEIMPELRRQKRPSLTDMMSGQIARIAAKGFSLEAYQPLAAFPDLYARFADLRSQDDVVKFVRTFGPLTKDGLQRGKGDNLFSLLRQAENMAAGNLHVGFVLCSLNARLVADHSGIHLTADPDDLLDALWLQYAQARAAGQASRCRHCNTLFATGPDAKRRRGAEFCSFECKTKFHSLKRSR